MKTDILFYGLLQAYPQLVFELTGCPTISGYNLVAVEVKEKNFRFDGVLLPPVTASVAAPIWFVEVQFQKRAGFYRDFFTKVALYLQQFAVDRPGRLLAILPSRAVDVEVPSLMPERVRRLREQAQGTVEEGRVLEWLEALLVYRYSKQSREEIAQMFALGDLRETRVYQEALNEGIQLGKQEGKQEGEAQLVLRLLARRLGSLTAAQRQQIASLSLSKLEDLGEALLDWQSPADLTQWLNGL